MDNTPDKQTIFKDSPGYFEIHSKELLKKNYIITKETKDYCIFETNISASINKEPEGVSVLPQYGNGEMSNESVT